MSGEWILSHSSAVASVPDTSLQRGPLTFFAETKFALLIH